MTTQEVGDALLLLAGQFQSEGAITSAIRCLEAIAQSPQPLYPLTEGQARRQLASLLLAHTHNVGEAKKHLEKTQLLLGKISGNWELKMGVVSDLGRCHKLLGNVRLQGQMYQTGLDMCQDAQQQGGCANRQLWEIHFLLRLADSLVTSGQSHQAAAMVEAGMSRLDVTKIDPRLKIHCLLFILQLQLVDEAGPDMVQQTLMEANAIFTSLPAERSTEHMTLQLKVHFHVLRVLMLLRTGNHSELVAPLGEEGHHRPSWMPATVCALEDLMSMLGGTEGVAWEYEWMTPASVMALVHLLCAQMLQPLSKLKHVAAHLQKCQSIAEAELSKLGVDYTPAADGSSKEMLLPHHAIWDSRLLLVLRFLALEGKAHVHLTLVDLQTVQAVICDAVGMVRSFPTLLQQLEPSISFLIGLYCHSMSAFDDAAKCFLAAKTDPPSQQWANLVSCHAALSWLSAGSSAALQQAVEVLGKQASQAEEPSPGDVTSLQERALSLLSGGLIKQRLGVQEGTKSMLSEALRIAHGQLSNQQLVCQILNILGPISLVEGDIGGAQQMLSSSFQIGKGIHDLPAMVEALTHLRAVLLVTGQAEQAQSNDEYTARKAAEVNRVAAAAMQTASHASIMQHAKTLGIEQRLTYQ
mmetsp:Transcript_32135/g.91160  ORF Transcript_32135/g.91160 Transcript_32135/m.91160 type:complete len:637 (+) Transcript_32135:111-2021(+)|eukprot:CAMPEP_0117659888 /NCGR_PEP_ID=MMETSP0804-20121206/6668_1 /TAXON_ID=1074897 /ORGANISM="Tetraselmis astigmatica, Strain CCMP880" /LENGTH=636 /DNA_ID=CAMNT_0005466567 /DNA_START=26 /DNA_END=1936 /DNA_ORIENTATION=-